MAGKVKAAKFPALFRKMELLSSAVKTKTHLVTIKSIQNLYPPFGADLDDWTKIMELLDYKKRILAENTTADAE